MFPKSQELFKKRIVAIKEDEDKFFKVTPSIRICSRHFTVDYLLPEYVNGWRFLKERFVASVFKFRKPEPTKLKNPKPQRPVPSLVTQRLAQSRTQLTYDSPSPVTEDFTNSEAEKCRSCVQSEARFVKQASGIQHLNRELQDMQQQLGRSNEKVQRLTRELDMENEHVDKLESTVPRTFSVECFNESPEDRQFYTGLPSHDTFIDILRFIEPGKNGEKMKAWSTTCGTDTKTSLRRPRSMRPQV